MPSMTLAISMRTIVGELVSTQKEILVDSNEAVVFLARRAKNAESAPSGCLFPDDK
jgi:hypothetical protein